MIIAVETASVKAKKEREDGSFGVFVELSSAC